MGHNVNSERLASSNRLTEMSIDHYRVRVKTLKTTVQEVIASYDTKVKFGECVSIHTLNLVKTVVKAERLREMYACALEMETDDFDLDLIRESQTLGDSGHRKPRRVPTEEEKDHTRLEKAEAKA